MENKLVNGGELVIVRQLPVIEDKMEDALASIRGRLDAMSSLAVTEENCKEIKKVRAELNKEFGQLETMRKQVKAAVEAPYKRFESGAYKKMADAYKSAIAQLDGSIKDVEEELKMARQKELFDYFEAYRMSLGLDGKLADPRRSGINIGLSGSMASFKKKAKEWLDGLDADLKMIDCLENRDEVLAEYRQSLSVTDAVRIVTERNRLIDEERKRREAEEEERKRREEHEAEIDAVLVEQVVTVEPVEEEQTAAEVPIEEIVLEEQFMSARFLGCDVWGTEAQLKELKAFLKEKMFEFCSRKDMFVDEGEETDE